MKISAGERRGSCRCRQQQERMSQVWRRQPLFKACLKIEAIFHQIFCSIMQRQGRFLTDKFEAVWLGCWERLQKLSCEPQKWVWRAACGKRQLLLLWSGDCGGGGVRTGLRGTSGHSQFGGGRGLEYYSMVVMLSHIFHMSTSLSSSFALWGITAQPLILRSSDVLLRWE